jgi:hypothetical protein
MLKLKSQNRLNIWYGIVIVAKVLQKWNTLEDKQVVCGVLTFP